MWRDDGADVAALDHGVADLAECALALAHDLPHLGMPRDGRHGPVDLGLADRAVTSVVGDLDRAVRAERHRVLGRERRERAAVVERDPVAEGEPGQRAVHRPGVEVAEAEPRGKGRRDRALAGARRAVDGHDHERSCIALGPLELREHVVEAREAHLDRLRTLDLDALA